MSIASTKRGLSLPEVLVASAMFALMAVVLVLTERFCSRAAGKSDVHSDTYRMVMITLDHIRSELQPSRLITVEADEVDYKLPVYSGGELRTSALSGTPIWQPAGIAYHTLQMLPGGRVVALHTLPGGDIQPQRLGDLGELGKLEFAMPLAKLVEVTAYAQIADPGGRKLESNYRATMQFYVAGQT